MNTILYIGFCLVAAVAAEDLSQGSEGTNMENSMGYTFNSLIDNGGKPSGQAYAYLGGKLTQIPQAPTYYQADPNNSLAPPPSGSSTGLSNLSSAAYFVAGVAAAISIWYVCAIVALPHSKKSTEEFKDEKSADSPTKESSSDKKEEKSRRRRSVRQSDEDMTMLASMVLSAVQSGECLQKSICILGSQMAGRKGKMADGLLTTLLPARIQQSDYYVILRKSLRGELSCEKFGCNVH